MLFSWSMVVVDAFREDEVSRICEGLDNGVVFPLADPGTEGALALFQYDYAAAVGQMVIDVAAAGETAVAEADAEMVEGIVVVVIVAAANLRGMKKGERGAQA